MGGEPRRAEVGHDKSKGGEGGEVAWADMGKRWNKKDGDGTGSDGNDRGKGRKRKKEITAKLK